MGLTQITGNGLSENISIDSNTLKVDGTNNRIGIGTSSPANILHLSSTGTPTIQITDEDNSGIVKIENGSGSLFLNADTGNTVSNSRIQFSIDGSERLRIDSFGRVGIGNSSPSNYSSSGRDLVVGAGSSAAGLTVASGATNTGNIYFAAGSTGDDQVRGQIRYNHSTEAMDLYTDASLRMRINSSGNVGIGTTSPVKQLQVGAHGSSSEGTIALASTTSGTCSILMGDGGTGTDVYRGYVQYNHSADAMLFATSASERMRIDSSGRLLAGTTSTYDGEASNFVVVTSGHTGITVASTGSNKRTNLYFADGTSGTAAYAGGFTYDHSDNSLLVRTASTERMRIDSSGVVKLTQSGNNPRFGSLEASGDAFRLKAFSGNASHNATMQFFTGADSPTERMRLDSSGRLQIGSTNQTSAYFTVTDGAQVTGAALNGNNNCATLDYYSSTARLLGHDSTSGGKIAFFTNAAGAGLSEQMRIQSDGVVLIGKTSESYTTAGIELDPDNWITVTNNSLCLRLNRTNTTGEVAQFMYDNTIRGRITVSSTSTAYTTVSDYRLKENVVNLDGAIDRVKQLAPKRFNFTVEPDVTVDGFLAHETQTVVPEAVIGTHNEVDDDGNPVMQEIDQSKLVPLLAAALQEAIAKIETLETKVAALEAAE